MHEQLESFRQALSSLPEYQLLFLISGVLLALAILAKPLVVKLFPYQTLTASSLRLLFLLAALAVMSFALRAWRMGPGPTGFDPTQLGL